MAMLVCCVPIFQIIVTFENTVCVRFHSSLRTRLRQFVWLIVTRHPAGKIADGVRLSNTARQQGTAARWETDVGQISVNTRVTGEMTTVVGIAREAPANTVPKSHLLVRSFCG